MLKIIDSSTDPYWNLAAEEYILTHFDGPVFRLWRNSDAIIVGRYQNAFAEIDRSFAQENSIPVVRRMTGGGAVFHDLGNVNYSFFNFSDESTCGGRFTDIIRDALSGLGLDVAASGRNDLLLDGKKISGTAVCKMGGRVLQHGTLLFSAEMGRLSGALKPRPEKFEGKGVKSVRSRVTNIAEHLASPMSAGDFFNYMSGTLPQAESYSYSEEDLAAIKSLRDGKYSTYGWNYGNSPSYNFKNIKKFPSGLVEVYMNVQEGRISDIDIKGDYFFRRPTEDLCKLLVGCQLDKEKIADRLSGVTVDDYISGLTIDLFVSLLLF